MTVSVLGKDGRIHVCRSVLLQLGIHTGFDIHLFPVPLTVNGSEVNGTDIALSELELTLPCGAVAVLYEAPKDLRTRLSEKGVSVIDLSRCESYLEKNAYLTAVGTVARILSSENRCGEHLSVGIIGYGRIGSQLARIFAFLGTRVRIFTSKCELCRDLCMLGVSGIDSLSLNGEDSDLFSDLDILINTAPTRLLSPNSAPRLRGIRVIELAGGANMPPGVDYERFASLPSAMFANSAGRIMAEAIAEILGIDKQKS